MKEKIKIAVSGKSGCGNTTVSRLVSERLDLRMINYTFHSMADEMGIAFDELCRLAQTDTQYDIHLDTRQVEMAREGNCVLGSRLAIWVLKEADLKVYLTASPEVRAQRIQKREGGDWVEVYEKTRKRDERDSGRYQRLYQIDNNRYDFADLIINTDRLLPEQITEIIVAAATVL